MTDDDIALSRLAAKAIGLEIGKFQGLISSMPDDYVDGGFMVGEVHPASGFRGYYWNPIDDDGDAFRLMVSLSLDVEFDGPDGVQVSYFDDRGTPCAVDQYIKDDPAAGVRRAIVRAAAELAPSK